MTWEGPDPVCPRCENGCLLTLWPLTSVQWCLGEGFRSSLGRTRWGWLSGWSDFPWECRAGSGHRHLWQSRQEAQRLGCSATWSPSNSLCSQDLIKGIKHLPCWPHCFPTIVWANRLAPRQSQNPELVQACPEVQQWPHGVGRGTAGTKELNHESYSYFPMLGFQGTQGMHPGTVITLHLCRCVKTRLVCLQAN
jgi:hypothetical protein